MTDAQHLFDYARRQFNDIADDVERHFEHVAGQLREWIPTDARLIRSPPPKRLPPPTTLQLIQRWILTHRAISAAAVAFVITGTIGSYVYIQNQKSRRKRRAKRSASGARTEAVVVVGAAANPLTSALYLDLERRGFVVYVVTNTAEDEQYVRSQSRVDLLSLPIDLVDPFYTQEQITRFKSMLSRDHYAFEDAQPHRMTFAGIILAPDTQSAAARVQDISSEEWSDALNAKVLHTIATTQLFLPTITEHQAKILLLTPSVTPSLQPPLHAIESAVYGALQGFAASLAAELRTEGVALSHFKLGHIDVPSVTAKQRRDGTAASRVKATPVRRLNDAVFDALLASRPARTRHVGRGSLAYDIIGSWVPAGFVGWMLGASTRRVGVVETAREDLHGSRASLTWEKVERDS